MRAGSEENADLLARTSCWRFELLYLLVAFSNIDSFLQIFTFVFVRLQLYIAVIVLGFVARFAQSCNKRSLFNKRDENGQF